MQNAVCGGAHQQREAIAPVAAHHDEVGADLLRFGVYFHLGSAQHDVLVVFVDTLLCGETGLLLTRLLVNFVLDAR